MEYLSLRISHLNVIGEVYSAAVERVKGVFDCREQKQIIRFRAKIGNIGNWISYCSTTGRPLEYISLKISHLNVIGEVYSAAFLTSGGPKQVIRFRAKIGNIGN